jgi:hypothetical protein
VRRAERADARLPAGWSSGLLTETPILSAALVRVTSLCLGQIHFRTTPGSSALTDPALGHPTLDRYHQTYCPRIGPIG